MSKFFALLISLFWLQLKVISLYSFHFENICEKTQFERRRFCIDYQSTRNTILCACNYFLESGKGVIPI
ncbi:MAG TPA: hypothetical protein DDZ36_04700 [Deltaproteobacteria bacterium]|nr:hypothetical protein [Deltaproteobacteria bacterium]